jgi:hypothetical protein
MYNRYQKLLIEARNILKHRAVYVVPITVPVTGILAKPVSNSLQRHRHGTHYTQYMGYSSKDLNQNHLLSYTDTSIGTLYRQNDVIIIIIIISTDVTWFE